MYHRPIDTPLGTLTLVGDDEALCGVYYERHTTDPDRAAFGPARAGAFADAERELREYLAGERTAFSLTWRWASGTPFQRAVWELIAAIPYGETRTYAQLAGALAAPTHPRAVGGAVAANPLSIVVACHRVVPSSGRLSGYAGGVERKRALLALEAGQPRSASTAIRAA